MFDFLVREGINPDTKGWHGLSNLHFAAQEGNTEMIEYLLTLGLDIHEVDDRGRTPLHHSIYRDPQTVSLLLQKGINPDYVEKYQARAIYYATKAKREESAEILMNAGASIEPDMQGRSPVLEAALSQQWKLLKLFTQKGFQVESIREDVRRSLENCPDTELVEMFDALCNEQEIS